MNEINEMLRSLDLLNETELEAVAKLCQEKIEWKKKARHKALQQELMANLQQTISAILGNGFDLTIENLDNPNWIVRLNPAETYHIEIE